MMPRTSSRKISKRPRAGPRSSTRSPSAGVRTVTAAKHKALRAAKVDPVLTQELAGLRSQSHLSLHIHCRSGRLSNGSDSCHARQTHR